MLTAICTDCGAEAAALAWRCERCSGTLDLRGLPEFAADAIIAADFSLWRYRTMLSLAPRISLGEGLTPLRPLAPDNPQILAKLEYLNPTGSFKDRGTATMLNHLLAHGARECIDNSSGNAGASLAAYAGLAGLPATVYVPAASTIASKKQLIRSFGARIIASDKLPADVYAAAESATYASHAWNPYFILGQMTAAWEIWEQLGRHAPDAVATPVGHGGLFLGIYRGFHALLAAGIIAQVPRMIAVQSAGVDPIVRAWEAGAAQPAACCPSPSVADGILVTEPVRGQQILAALRASGGFALRVDNDAIIAAQKALQARGMLVEPTAAAPAAALPQILQRLPSSAVLVLALTGSGLKTLDASV